MKMDVERSSVPISDDYSEVSSYDSDEGSDAAPLKFDSCYSFIYFLFFN